MWIPRVLGAKTGFLSSSLQELIAVCCHITGETRAAYDCCRIFLRLDNTQGACTFIATIIIKCKITIIIIIKCKITIIIIKCKITIIIQYKITIIIQNMIIISTIFMSEPLHRHRLHQRQWSMPSIKIIHFKYFWNDLFLPIFIIISSILFTIIIIIAVVIVVVIIIIIAIFINSLAWRQQQQQIQRHSTPIWRNHPNNKTIIPPLTFTRVMG